MIWHLPSFGSRPPYSFTLPQIENNFKSVKIQVMWENQKFKDNHYLKIGKASDLQKQRERLLFRFFEILPAASSFLTLILLFLFSKLRPVATAIFVIGFTFYWFFRIIYFSLHLKTGYQKMRQNERTDWLEKLRGIKTKNWEDIYHLVIFAMYKEPYEIVRESFLALSKTDYPKNKIIAVLGIEERAGQAAEKIAQKIEKEFAEQFSKLLITVHPKDIEGELAGKGANETFATKKAREFIDENSIPYENIIVSLFDIDTVVFPKYFGCLTYYYLTCQNPQRTSFQPIPLYINNIWQTPILSRVFSFSSTFWHTMNQERPEKLITFSSHAMSFATLVDVGFKQTNVVSDDSRIFWQCFLKYNGDYQTQPIYYPVSMDANCAKTFFKTLKNIYKQQKRWAYGVGEIPYVFFGFLKNKKIPFKEEIRQSFNLFEGHWSWATNSFIIFLGGWLPLMLGGRKFNVTLLSYNLPHLTSQLLTISMLGILFSIYLSIQLLPPRPPQYGKWKYVILIIEWFFLPIMLLFFSSLPALHAQIHWLLGKYLGFWPTEKVRK